MGLRPKMLPERFLHKVQRKLVQVCDIAGFCNTELCGQNEVQVRFADETRHDSRGGFCACGGRESLGLKPAFQIPLRVQLNICVQRETASSFA